MSASPRSAGVSVTAIEAVYVPADDFTDPAVTAISSHLDSMIVLVQIDGRRGHVSRRRSFELLVDIARSNRRRRRALSHRRGGARSDRALQGTAGHHFASWHRGAERPGSLDRRASQAIAALPHPALRGHRSLYRQAWPIRPAGRDAQGLPDNTRRHLRPVGGEFALHGRHHRRSAREGGFLEPRKRSRHEIADYNAHRCRHR